MEADDRKLVLGLASLWENRGMTSVNRFEVELSSGHKEQIGS